MVPSPLNVFVSFRTSSDLENARELARRLSERSVPHTFLGEGSKLPDDLSASQMTEWICRHLKGKLEQSTVLVVVTSRETYDSGWLQWELASFYALPATAYQAVFLCFFDNESEVRTGRVVELSKLHASVPTWTVDATRAGHQQLESLVDYLISTQQQTASFELLRNRAKIATATAGVLSLGAFAQPDPVLWCLIFVGLSYFAVVFPRNIYSANRPTTPGFSLFSAGYRLEWIGGVVIVAGLGLSGIFDADPEVAKLFRTIAFVFAVAMCFGKGKPQLGRLIARRLSSRRAVQYPGALFADRGIRPSSQSPSVAYPETLEMWSGFPFACPRHKAACWIALIVAVASVPLTVSAVDSQMIGEELAVHSFIMVAFVIQLVLVVWFCIVRRLSRIGWIVAMAVSLIPGSPWWIARVHSKWVGHLYSRSNRVAQECLDASTPSRQARLDTFDMSGWSRRHDEIIRKTHVELSTASSDLEVSSGLGGYGFVCRICGSCDDVEVDSITGYAYCLSCGVVAP